eukprot:7259715-Heterocapsa_arctica.AAC.1
MDHRTPLPKRRGLRARLLSRRRRDRALRGLPSRQGRRMEGSQVGRRVLGPQACDAECPPLRQQRGADEVVPPQLR